MAKNISKVIKQLEKQGFILKSCDGSRFKLYPPDKDKKFYSLHIGEAALHPLKRFAKKEWNLDLFNL